MLHITNGDSVSGGFPEMGLPGEMISWRDILHEGPVPAGLSLAELRAVRAVFIAEQGWGDYQEVAASFAQRDATLAAFHAHEEVVLWFEHDLYDQLQLLQLLDWLAGQDLGATRLSLICLDAFPGIEPFLGLGQLPPSQLATLFPTRQPVTPAQLALARAAWAAFRAPDPTAIEAVLAGDTSVLPFLAAALRRHLEQFPAADSGLSRTERQLLDVIAAGARTPHEILRQEQAADSYLIQGDTGLWSCLRGLSAAPTPLVLREDGTPFALPSAHPLDRDFIAQRLTLTPAGQRVRAGAADWIHLNGINRWLGGVHLIGHEAAWRWDRARARLIARVSNG